MYTSLADLSDARYISLTTRRRDGSLVSTPVWVVSDDGRRLLVWTHASTWKVKRIRRGRFVLLPIGPNTHGHGTHTWAALWKQHLQDLLARSAH